MDILKRATTGVIKPTIRSVLRAESLIPGHVKLEAMSILEDRLQSILDAQQESNPALVTTWDSAPSLNVVFAMI